MRLLNNEIDFSPDYRRVRNDNPLNMSWKKNFYVYIVTNPSKTTLYIGITNNLKRRLWEHYENRGTENSFAGKYYCFNLIYYEHYFYVKHAINREKEIKKWSRAKKERLITEENPDWQFLQEDLFS